MQRHNRNTSSPLAKLKLFGLISAVVVMATAPLTFYHMPHNHMIYHILIHIASLITATFLSFISVVAFVRDGRAKLLFMSLGFITFAILEIIMLVTVTGTVDETMIPVVNAELTHIVLLIIITLFGIGILKVN